MKEFEWYSDLEALDWFSARLEVIHIEGEENVVFCDTWNAHSFYFYDAAGNIAECIVRHDLNNDSGIPFDGNSLLCVNEIGLRTDDISEMDRQLENGLGSHFWKGDKERFGAHGTQVALILLPNYKVKETWFPTEIPIKPNPLEAVVEQAGKHYDFQFRDSAINIGFSED